ncbi:hypothetical protein CCUS01_10743 [Colletotrichum cuscutae]|uniref:Uncharacterized protein n=1 Tax=Colletotrichum cuscutae TaxID=1209917 RepID=A0AAI9U6N2_9PEZI|nr:hypothetical protein CCUS01_10743 [Colletotrichum cuscutae]
MDTPSHLLNGYVELWRRLKWPADPGHALFRGARIFICRTGTFELAKGLIPSTFDNGMFRVPNFIHCRGVDRFHLQLNEVLLLQQVTIDPLDIPCSACPHPLVIPKPSPRRRSRTKCIKPAVPCPRHHGTNSTWHPESDNCDRRSSNPPSSGRSLQLPFIPNPQFDFAWPFPPSIATVTSTVGVPRLFRSMPRGCVRLV